MKTAQDSMRPSTIVVKIGSALLTNEGRGLDGEAIERWVRQIAELHHRGFRVASISGHPATPGVFFGSTAPRLIILAERRARTADKKSQPAPPPMPPPKSSEE